MAGGIDNERFRRLLRLRPGKALKLVYDLYYQSLCSLALYLTRDVDASKDIVHDTFLILWSERKKLSKHHDKSIEHYLVRIVRNKSVSYYKRKKTIDIDALLMITDFAEVEDNPIELELMVEMRKVIAGFSRREKECLLLKIDQRMSLDHIALHLGVSRKMVEKSQNNAMKKLRKWAVNRK
jgi:RNA polymerase sigma-70 factor, ECF subfamily